MHFPVAMHSRGCILKNIFAGAKARNVSTAADQEMPILFNYMRINLFCSYRYAKSKFCRTKTKLITLADWIFISIWWGYKITSHARCVCGFAFLTSLEDNQVLSVDF